MSTPGPRRRAIIAAIPVAAGLAAPAPPHPKREPQPATLRFFTAHQAAVVEAATARIAPGPHDDPAEAGHPGAREAGVTGYIDTMLGALAETGHSRTARSSPAARGATGTPPART